VLADVGVSSGDRSEKDFASDNREHEI
jgi:hypothetical protein